MPVDVKAVEAAVFDAIGQNNELLPEDSRLPLDRDAILMGKSALIDSLGLVNLIATVEQCLADAFGKPVTLADERAMSRKNSPFRTVGTIIDYSVELLSEEA